MDTAVQVKKESSLKTRVLVALLLLPVALVVVYLGGWVYTLAIAAVIALASLEYAHLFQAAKLEPSGVLIATGCVALVLSRGFSGFVYTPILITLIVLAVMIYALVAFERGKQQAGTDFAVSLAGIFYLGWLGAYLVSLRDLPGGAWWVLTVLAAVWAVDSFAYLVGSRIGRHKMTPRLSPKKSWEGYFGGIILGVPTTALLALVWQFLASGWLASTNLGPATMVTPARAALIGLAMAVFTVFGDLGESMIKRQVGQKDSGTLLPGHGGVFDRIDSWLWGAVIGYYMIVYLFA
jgi:phosphatidate cytidylyltransferase